MCGLLQRIFDAARDRDCPIVHISALEDEPPLIASTTCLGDRPTALVDISADQYLGLMAEIWGLLVVEFAQDLPTLIRMRSAQPQASTSQRSALLPHTIAGYLQLPLQDAAVHYTLDSYGQETTILYCGLRSVAEIQTYWRERTEMYRTFSERYSCNDRDLGELLRRLDRCVRPATFDVERFAAERDLRLTVREVTAGAISLR
jgi:hypothetical protein